MSPRRSSPLPAIRRSAFAGFRFPPEIILLAVRWYLRYGLSYRDAEELLGERGIEVDHLTVYRAVDQYGQIIDVYVSAKRDFLAARRFSIRTIRGHGDPVEVGSRPGSIRCAVSNATIRHA